MKKGLLLTLIVAVALIYSTGFSYAPVLNNIPDIIVGDNGDTDNFFRFSDAFVFDSYVTDADSTISQLKWSFSKQGSTQDLTINGLDEETADATFVNPTNDLRAAAPAATFQFNPLPAEPSTLANVLIALYVSDGTFKDSQAVTVYPVDGADDGYSAGIPPIYTEKFDTVGDWVCWLGGAQAPSNYGDWSGGAINVKFPTKASTAWASPGWTQWLKWNSGHTGIDYVITSDLTKLFILKATMSSTTTVPNQDVPGARIRVQNENFVWSSQSVFGYWAVGTPGRFPLATPKDFFVLWQPQGISSNAFIAIDAWANGNEMGTVSIAEINVYSVPLTEINATAVTEKNITSFTGWAAAGSQSSTVTVGASQVTFGDLTTGWSTVANYVALNNAITPGSFYRFKYAIAKSGSGFVDDIRLRVNDSANGSSTSEFVINDFDATTHVGTTASDYMLYHWADNSRDGSTASDIAIWCDSITNAQATANASKILSGIVVEKITLPQLQ